MPVQRGSDQSTRIAVCIFDNQIAASAGRCFGTVT